MLTFPPSSPTAFLRDAQTRQWLLFDQPQEVIVATRTEEVLAKFQAVEDAVHSTGVHAVGFVSYEAAPGFDPSLATGPQATYPLLWFGLYRNPRVVDPPAVQQPSERPQTAWEASVSPDAYQQAFEAVKAWIREGETYQVNLTYRLRRAFTEAPWPFFVRMVAAQGSTYGAFITTRDWSICSASPELFFRLDGNHIESRPMKGTARRGLTLAHDLERAAVLCASEKERAENLMITDMVRNDIGRIALPGTVCVPQLLQAEKYPTLWQLTSTVTAKTHASAREIFAALFPPASITGAPKARTMRLIAETETTPRNIYTGTIGFMAPGRRAQFNVAIRTLSVDHAQNLAEYGVGGGIVWDSVCATEQAECQTKAQILGEDTSPFSLLETLLWRPGEGILLLERHLARLAESAAYFDIPIVSEAIRQHLSDLTATLPQSPRRLRLLVAQNGTVTSEAAPFTPAPVAAPPLRVTLAPRPVDKQNPFLYHKTTRRRIYEQALAACPGYDDVLLFNTEGEVTESSRFNVVADIDGRLCTPPVSCGLLPGTYRAQLLESGVLSERAIPVNALRQTPRLFLINSVRGMVPASFCPG